MTTFERRIAVGRYTLTDLARHLLILRTNRGQEWAPYPVGFDPERKLGWNCQIDTAAATCEGATIPATFADSLTIWRVTRTMRTTPRGGSYVYRVIGARAVLAAVHPDHDVDPYAVRLIGWTTCEIETTVRPMFNLC